MLAKENPIRTDLQKFLLERNMEKLNYLVWALMLALFAQCSALGSGQNSDELNNTELSSLALLAVASSLPELRGTWRDSNNNTFTVVQGSTAWVALVNNIQFSFSATQTMRSYNNSVRRYFYECTAQTGFGCTVGTFSAVQWTISGSTLSLCEYHSNQTSLTAAQSGDTSAVNASNLSTGCEGFSWNSYTRISF